MALLINIAVAGLFLAEYVGTCEKQLSTAHDLQKRGADVAVDQYRPFDQPIGWTWPDRDPSIYEVITCRVIYLSAPAECGMSASELCAIARPGSLRTLELSGLRVDDRRELKRAFQKTQLQSLTLSNCKGIQGTLSSFGLFDKLDGLELVDTDVSSDDLKSLLSRNLRLSHFALEGYRDSTFDIESLRKLQSLRVLSLRRSRVLSKSLGSLGSLKNLIGLDLSDCDVTQEDVGAISDLENLRSLSLANTSLGDDAVRLIGKMKALEELDLSGCPITNVSLGYINHSRSLKRFIIKNTRITEDQYARFSQNSSIVSEYEAKSR